MSYIFSNSGLPFLYTALVLHPQLGRHRSRARITASVVIAVLPCCSCSANSAFPLPNEGIRCEPSGVSKRQLIRIILWENLRVGS